MNEKVKPWKWTNTFGNKAWLTSDHDWENENGYVDSFASGEGIHNGPQCSKCGYTECWHCVQVPLPCDEVDQQTPKSSPSST